MLHIYYLKIGRKPTSEGSRHFSYKPLENMYDDNPQAIVDKSFYL